LFLNSFNRKDSKIAKWCINCAISWTNSYGQSWLISSKLIVPSQRRGAVIFKLFEKNIWRHEIYFRFIIDNFIFLFIIFITYNIIILLFKIFRFACKHDSWIWKRSHWSANIISEIEISMKISVIKFKINWGILITFPSKNNCTYQIPCKYTSFSISLTFLLQKFAISQKWFLRIYHLILTVWRIKIFFWLLFKMRFYDFFCRSLFTFF